MYPIILQETETIEKLFIIHVPYHFARDRNYWKIIHNSWNPIILQETETIEKLLIIQKLLKTSKILSLLKCEFRLTFYHKWRQILMIKDMSYHYVF